MKRSHLLVLSAASVIVAAFAIRFVDGPVSQWIAAHDRSDWWERLVTVLEYPTGIKPWTWTIPIVLVAGVLVTLVVPRWRRMARAWMYIALVYLLTRNLMVLGKTVTGRLRPSQWVAQGGSTFGYVGDGQSFPSGHVTVFGGLILPLVMIYPRARPLLVLIPFVMVARVAVLAHFVSDVFGGLALTAFVAWAFAPLLDLPPALPPPPVAPARR
ncbi:MAG TPA: phosphatase PAP2 family protein [Kofleriaceae bacterium]|nr:phosphatase PAP2 family protein [Kofleriaceae bacterium]